MSVDMYLKTNYCDFFSKLKFSSKPNHPIPCPLKITPSSIFTQIKKVYTFVFLFRL